MIAQEAIKRLSAAERRLRRMEALLGADSVTNEISDFPTRGEWVPSEAFRLDRESQKLDDRRALVETADAL